MFAVALLLLLAVSSSTQDFLACPPPLAKYPFDAEKFSGDWFLHSKWFSHQKDSIDGQCWKVHYESHTNGNVTRNSMDITTKTKDDKEMKFQVKGQEMFPGSSVSQAAWKSPEDGKWQAFQLSVLATDYTSYAILHGCKLIYNEKTDLFEKLVMADIWGRQTTMDASLLSTLKSIVSSANIDPAQMEDLDNSAC